LPQSVRELYWRGAPALPDDLAMIQGLNRKSLLVMVAAAAILMITMGIRQSMGLFIAPIIDTTHVGYAAMSFAMAVGQLMWGAAQPTFGALADRSVRIARCWPAR